MRSPLVDREGLYGTLTPIPALFHQRPQCPAVGIVVDVRGQCLDVVRIGDVDDQRLDARPSDRVGVPVASNAGEHVETPPGQFARGGRADAGGCTGDDGDRSYHLR